MSTRSFRNRFATGRLFSSLVRTLGAATVLGAAAPLQAHPGHGWFAYGAGHVVTSPYHLAVLALFGATTFAGAHLIRRRLPRRAMQCLGMMALAVSVMLWGLRS
jgi:hypothetical protein